MAENPLVNRPSHPGSFATPQSAHARVTLGGFTAEAEVAVTPAGLLAIGGMVSLILVSVAPIILAARARRTADPDQPDKP